MGFLGHNFGSRHARRSSKGSINAGYHLVFKNSLAHGIGVQVPSKLVKKTKTPPLCERLPGEPLTRIKKFFFNRTKKSSRICRGFEQLSSYCGWRVTTKKLRANILARVGVPSFDTSSIFVVKCQSFTKFSIR